MDRFPDNLIAIVVRIKPVSYNMLSQPEDHA